MYISPAEKLELINADYKKAAILALIIWLGLFAFGIGWRILTKCYYNMHMFICVMVLILITTAVVIAFVWIIVSTPVRINTYTIGLMTIFNSEIVPGGSPS